MPTERSLAEFLISNRFITEEQFARTAKAASETSCSFPEALVNLGLANEQTIAVELSKWLGYPLASLENKLLIPEKGQGLESLVLEAFARQYMVMPLFRDNNMLTVAMADPENLIALDNLKIITRCDITPCVAGKSQLLKALDGFYRKSGAGTEDLAPEPALPASGGSAEAGPRGEQSPSSRWFSATPMHLRLLGGFLVLQGMILAASIWFVNKTYTDFVKSDVESKIKTTHKVLLAVLERQEELLLTTLEMLGKDVVLQKAVATSRGDTSTIESAAMTIRNRIGLDILWVADTRGRLYADKSRSLDAQETTTLQALVVPAPKRRKQAAMLNLGGRLHHLAWVPIVESSEFEKIGILIGGHLIDDTAATEVKGFTQSNLSFEAGGNIVASTLDPENLAYLVENRKSLVLAQSKLLGPDGARQLVLPLSPSEGLLVYIQQPWDEVLKPLKELNQILISIGMSGFALAVLGVMVTAALSKL